MRMFSGAEAYERFMGRWSRRLAPELVVLSGARAGEAVLDVGSGTGALSFALLEVIDGGRITGIDPSTEYVRHAAGRSEDQRLRFEVGDAQQLGFPDASFDRTLSALVLNFVADPGEAVGEMVRVTRPGGTVTAAIWDYGEGMQMLRTFWDEAGALDPAGAARDEARMPLCRSGELAALFGHEGLEAVHEAPLAIATPFSSFADYWAPFMLGQGPAGSHVASLSGGMQAELEQRLRARLLGGGPDRPFELSARAWAVRGTVAGR